MREAKCCNVEPVVPQLSSCHSRPAGPSALVAASVSHLDAVMTEKKVKMSIFFH